MASLRQVVEGGIDSESQLDVDSAMELEGRLSVKLSDANRTLTSLTSVWRRTRFRGQHPQVDLRQVFAPQNGWNKIYGLHRRRDYSCTKFTACTVEETIRVLPSHSIVRLHHAGDFCLIVALLISEFDFAHHDLAHLPEQVSTPNFSCSKGELFIPRCMSPFPAHCVEMINPYPGGGPAVNETLYPEVTVRATT